MNSLLQPDGKAGFVAQIKSDYVKLREEHAARTTSKKMLTLEAARARRTPDRLGHGGNRGARVSRLPRRQRSAARRTGALHRLVAVFPHLGIARPLSRHLRRPLRGQAGARTLRRRAAAPAGHRQWQAHPGPRGATASSRPTASATTSSFTPTRSRTEVLHDASTSSVSSRRNRPANGTVASRISSRRNRAVARIISARFAVTAGHGVDALVAQFQSRARRLQHDHDPGAGRSARGSVRRVPAPAGAHRMGLRARGGAFATKSSSAKNTAASVRRPVIRRALITPRSRRCSA